MNTIETGYKTESLALDYLLENGLILRDRNFRSRFGELDLIMQDHESIVFVEVRLRTKTEFGDGAASVDHRKQRKLCKTALNYLKLKRLNNHICRFDVISVSRSIDDSVKIDWIKNAFDYQG